MRRGEPQPGQSTRDVHQERKGHPGSVDSAWRESAKLAQRKSTQQRKQGDRLQISRNGEQRPSSEKEREREKATEVQGSGSGLSHRTLGGETEAVPAKRGHHPELLGSSPQTRGCRQGSSGRSRTGQKTYDRE